MEILRGIARWLGLGLYGLNFWVLVLYGYYALTPIRSSVADVLLVVLGPLFIFLGIKFYSKLKTQFTALFLLYFGLFFIADPQAWLGSVFAFLFAYFLEETFGRKAGLQVDFNADDDFGIYEAKLHRVDTVLGGHHMVNGINPVGDNYE